MKTLLLRPPRRNHRDASLAVPPLGLAYLAAVLRQAGREVEIIDAYALGWSWDRLSKELARRRPDVLGLGTMTPVADTAYRAAEIARPFARHILLGGPHPTAVGHAVFEACPAIDHAVSGEGEEVLLPLLDWLEGGELGPPPPGVLSPGHPLKAHTPQLPIDALPRPARDLLPGSVYRYLFATRPGFATMITSRGCPFRCSFCDKSVSGSQWRARSARDVVDEMEHLHQEGVGFINFYDDNFTLHRGRVVEICEEILRRDLDMEWKCEGRVDSVDLPLLQLLRKAGCRTMAYGVESGNPETLALLRKDITIEETEQAFSDTRAAGIRPLAYMILGAPGESQKAVRKSIRFTREIGADYVQFSTLTALPGTPLFAQQGHRPRQSVSNPLDADLDRHTVSDLPPEALSQLMREAWTGFYLRPGPILRLARDAVASGSLREGIRLGRQLAQWRLSP